MTTAELLDLFEYNRWAHEKILHAGAELGAEKYTEQIGRMTLRSALQKMLAEEVVWLSRWEGHSLADTPDYSECTDATALAGRWKSLWNRQHRFLDSLTDDELASLVGIRLSNGMEAVQPLGETLMHVVNQATYLRGQAGALIRQLGGTTPDCDYFMYCVTRGSDELNMTDAS